MNSKISVPSASFYLCEACSFFILEGKDQVDFLQRQTTNDLRRLSTGRAILTILTSPAARILDVLTTFKSSYLVSNKGVDWLGLLTLPNYGDRTLKFLKSRIFFMDQVTIEDLTEKFFQIELFGAGIESSLDLLGFKEIPVVGEIRSTTIDKFDVLILSKMNGVGLGYKVIIPCGNWAPFRQKMLNFGIDEIDKKNYEIIRIENGVPAGDHELLEAFTPLEVGLEQAVSLTKGCYTGQEVLARQVNYDKVTRKLCGLRFNKSTNLNDKLWVDGKLVGEITSTAESPQFGSIGLAVVRKPYHLPGIKIKAGIEEEYSIDGEIVELPFSQTR